MRHNGSCGRWKKNDRPEAFAIRLLLLTGARKSEVLKARWEHVRLDLRLLIVPLSKSGKPRHIPLSDEAITVIRSIRASKGPPGCSQAMLRESPQRLYLFWTGCGAA